MSNQREGTRNQKRGFVFFLIVSHLVMVIGCTSTRQTTLMDGEMPATQGAKIVSVTLKTGDIVQFDNEGGRYVEKMKEEKSYRAIVGLTESNKHIEIDPQTVLELKIETKESSGGGSFLVGMLVGMPLGVAVFYLIIFATYRGR